MFHISLFFTFVDSLDRINAKWLDYMYTKRHINERELCFVCVYSLPVRNHLVPDNFPVKINNRFTLYPNRQGRHIYTCRFSTLLCLRNIYHYKRQKMTFHNATS